MAVRKLLEEVHAPPEDQILTVVRRSDGFTIAFCLVLEADSSDKHAILGVDKVGARGQIDLDNDRGIVDLLVKFFFRVFWFFLLEALDG